jgi:hypothetical protein
MLGCAQAGAVSRLEQLMHAGQMLLLDGRLTPHSRLSADWDCAALTTRYGAHSHWEPLLGNLRYHERKVAIAPAPGHQDAIGEAVQLLCLGYSLVLLCVCTEEHICHRLLGASLTQDAMPRLSSPWEGRS